MSYQAGPFDKVAFAIGLLIGGAGLYFVLASLEVIPLPDGPNSVNGPIWLLTCAGTAFGFAGVAVIVRAVAGANDAHGDLPEGTSRRLRLLYSMMGPLIVASLAAIGTWIAFGSGERFIVFSMPFLEGPAKEWIGRAVFGIGAIITWLVALLTTRSVVSNFRNRDEA